MTPRHPTQERSRLRREQLLDAAVELLAEGGAQAVTHRAVAARAGVPPAATTYYFPSIQALTDEALRRHVRIQIDALYQLVTGITAADQSAEAIGRHFAEVLSEWSQTAAMMQVELYVDAARRTDAHAVVEESLAGYEALAVDVLTGLGVVHPKRAAVALVAVVDGFLLHRVARRRPAAEEAQVLYEACRAIVLAYSMEGEVMQRISDDLDPVKPVTDC